jgi:hypothetical protein
MKTEMDSDADRNVDAPFAFDGGSQEKDFRDGWGTSQF